MIFMLLFLQIIGWRDNARHILVYLTDAGFHFAGDGKVSIYCMVKVDLPLQKSCLSIT